jgi:hypothetical protein
MQITRAHIKKDRDAKDNGMRRAGSATVKIPKSNSNPKFINTPEIHI